MVPRQRLHCAAMEIYLTRAAIRQMALDSSTCHGRPVRDLEGEHTALQALIERPFSRSERALAAGWTNAFYLHRDQWCLLLWYEEERGILWLCYAGQHPEGEHSSVREVLSDRDAVDRYLPTNDDFHQLGPHSDDWHRRLVEDGSRRIDEARARPEHEVILDLVELRLAIRVDHETVENENLERIRLTFLHTEESARKMEVRWIHERISVTLAHLFPGSERSEFQHLSPSTAADAIMTFVWRPSRKPEQDQPAPTGTT